MQPNRTISPRQLTILMAVLIAGPIGCGLLLSYFTPRMPEPTLPALVKLETMWVPEDEKAENRRLVPCISVKNNSPFEWRNLSIGLNRQFYCQVPREISAGIAVSVPLEAFVARNGSVTFPAGNRDIKQVTVFAQVESGARAVSEHTIPPNSPIRKESTEHSSESDDTGWIPGA